MFFAGVPPSKNGGPPAKTTVGLHLVSLRGFNRVKCDQNTDFNMLYGFKCHYELLSGKLAE